MPEITIFCTVNPENITAEAWQFSRQTCWFAVLVDLTNGGSDDKLSTSQGDGAEILSEHSIVPKNEEHQKRIRNRIRRQKRRFGIEFDLKREK